VVDLSDRPERQQQKQLSNFVAAVLQKTKKPAEAGIVQVRIADCQLLIAN